MWYKDGDNANGISIHAPREGGDQSQGASPQERTISIHAPREGGDAFDFDWGLPIEDISIHAPREGGDRKDAQFYLRIFDK